MPPLLFLMRNMPIQSSRSSRQLAGPRLLRGQRPLANPLVSLSGITRDSTGAVLGGVTVQVFETATDRFVTEVISDATTGAYVVPVGIGTGPYYAVAYIAGAPDRGGTTVNTLVGA